MSVKLITIDASTKKTGVAYFYNGEYVTHHLLDYSKDTNMENRFASMAKGIWEILNRYDPDIIYIEEAYMGNNAQTMKILAKLQGVVYAWCMNNSCEFNTITPTQWRKWIGIKQSKGVKRNELKAQSIKYILDNYHLNVTDDEADAICIACAIIKKYENEAGA